MAGRQLQRHPGRCRGRPRGQEPDAHPVVLRGRHHDRRRRRGPLRARRRRGRPGRCQDRAGQGRWQERRCRGGRLGEGGQLRPVRGRRLLRLADDDHRCVRRLRLQRPAELRVRPGRLHRRRPNRDQRQPRHLPAGPESGRRHRVCGPERHRGERPCREHRQTLHCELPPGAVRSGAELQPHEGPCGREHRDRRAG